MSIVKLDRYRECQDCKKQFKLPLTTLALETNHPETIIYCVYCQSSNVAIIPKGDFRK